MKLRRIVIEGENVAQYWPAGISDGLIIPCFGCGKTVDFDFVVTDDTWKSVVPREYRTAALCLRCFDEMATHKGIEWVKYVVSVQYTGENKTLYLVPDKIIRYQYDGDRMAVQERDNETRAVPHAELVKQAVEQYNNLARDANHFNSVILEALEFYRKWGDSPWKEYLSYQEMRRRSMEKESKDG